MGDMNTTSIIDLQTYAHGQVIELPAFAEGQPFIARLKRPSMMALVKTGRIPNSLLKAANQLFTSDTEELFDSDNSQALSQMFDLMDILCDAAFVEPTFTQIKEAGVELTDDQYMFIFNYCQNGVKALESFRQQWGSAQSDWSCCGLQSQTLSDNGYRGFLYCVLFG